MKSLNEFLPLNEEILKYIKNKESESVLTGYIRVPYYLITGDPIIYEGEFKMNKKVDVKFFGKVFHSDK